MENISNINNSTDDKRVMVIRLLTLLVFVVLGMMIGGALSLTIGTDAMAEAQSRTLNLGERNQVRTIALINQLFTFLLAGVAFALVAYKNKAAEYLRLNSRNLLFGPVGVAMILASIPLVALTNWLNHLIPLPEVFLQMEESTQNLILQLLTMENAGELALNFVLIGLVPGIGEELVFRGILQGELERYTKKPWLSIIVAAIIFSAIHFQFAGFIPRMLLGMLLGFLYWRTRNLWVPIIAHVAYNSFQVFVAFFYKDLLLESLEGQTEMPQISGILFGVVAVGAIGYFIWQRTINTVAASAINE